MCGDGRRTKEVLLLQQKVTSPVMDGPRWKNPLISLLLCHPTTHIGFFFHALSCHLELSRSDLCDAREERVDRASPRDPALIILFIKSLFN